MVYSPRNAKVHFCGFAGFAQARHTSLFIAYGRLEAAQAGAYWSLPAASMWLLKIHVKLLVHI
jgi:hypothetical protein